MITEVRRSLVIQESINRINHKLIDEAIEKWDSEGVQGSYMAWLIYYLHEEWDRIVRDN